MYVYIIYICICIGRLFTKKSFHGETFGGNLWGRFVVHVNLLPNHVEIFTLRLSHDQNGRIYPWVNS